SFIRRLEIRSRIKRNMLIRIIKMGSGNSPNSIKALFIICATMIVLAGCATTEDLSRSYGVLSERLDAAEKRLAVLISQQTENQRQASQAEYAGIRKELRDLRVQNQEDIEITRRAITTAATIVDLTRLEDKTGQLLDGLEAKTSASLERRIQPIINDITVLKNRSELERITDEIERQKQELKFLKAQTEGSSAALVENRALIEKGESEIEKVGRELVVSKSVSAEIVGDITELREKLLQINGLMEYLQRNQAIIQRDQGIIQNALAGRIEIEKKLTGEYGAISVKINQIVSSLEFIAKYLDLEKKEPGPARNTQQHVPGGNELPSGGKSNENIPVESLYEQAYNAFTEGKYDKARREFQELLKRFPRGELSENAQFWIAESFFFEKQHERAIVEYAKVIEEHEAGSRRPHALLKQGLSYLALGDKTMAKIIFQKILEDHPHSTQARIARNRLTETN
ncbi:MAG: tol-pal system protein YbgF, partial [Candidatus Aenigmarchaeota archaeon]|nr:tol-pal system protein YbgF [Candidatus Aenigmarchaeota archaeon]